MTVPSAINRSGPYNGNGVTTVFDYEFKITNENYIQVIKASAGVETVLTIDADYIVSDVGNPAGGQVALTVPLPTGQTLTLIPKVPFTQEIDLENQGAYYAQTVEDALDLGVMRDQQLQEQVSRAVTIPASEDPAQLDGLVGGILRLADSADNIDTVAGIAADVTAVAANAANISTAAANIAAIIAAPAAAVSAAASAAAAAASASSVNLPSPVANTFLQRNAGNTAYLALSAAAVWTAIAATSAFDQAGTGKFSTDQGAPRIHRMTDRLFINDGVSFNGQFLSANIAGLSTDAHALHDWGPRDASVFVDSSVAGLAIVGHSESKKFAAWSGTAFAATPASAGVAGFSINNRVGGGGASWGGYFDAVRLTNGFTVGVEVAMANFGSESTITPFNVKTGGQDGGVAVWAQIGCGLDAVGYPGAIKDIAAGFVLLSSYADNSAKARSGFVIADGALRDRGGGVYEAFAMRDRHQIAWYRASDQGVSAFIWADVITGSPVGITMKTGQVEFTGGGTLVNGMTVGLTATGVSPYITVYGADANIGLQLYTKGTGAHEFFTNAAVKQFEIAHVANAVNFLQAKGAVTTGAPVLSAIGTDANIGMGHATKGTGVHSFFTNGTAKQFEIAHVANAVNNLSAAGGAAGAGVSMSALGTDANISISLQAKGSGSIFLNARSLIAFQVDSAASAVNRMAVINAATAGQPMLYVTGTDTNVSGLLQGQGTGGWQFKDGATNKKFEYNSTGIAFFGGAPVAKQTVGAALNTGGAETNTNIATRINEIRTLLINYTLA